MERLSGCRFKGTCKNCDSRKVQDDVDNCFDAFFEKVFQFLDIQGVRWYHISLPLNGLSEK